ncbi:hypothetical protein [Levilactobacillus zymae]|uniref:hypothetical protein n=1 Tax=Levilactobacillus zymae TaxID=267363 RepID=UPI0028B40248|nr:hypothetical protein [Levilactobacillus zymae]MDT6981330.1 hypothetical protein [Levilactobacillus zymae]
MFKQMVRGTVMALAAMTFVTVGLSSTQSAQAKTTKGMASFTRQAKEKNFTIRAKRPLKVYLYGVNNKPYLTTQKQVNNLNRQHYAGHKNWKRVVTIKKGSQLSLAWKVMVRNGQDYFNVSSKKFPGGKGAFHAVALNSRSQFKIVKWSWRDPNKHLKLKVVPLQKMTTAKAYQIGQKSGVIADTKLSKLDKLVMTTRTAKKFVMVEYMKTDRGIATQYTLTRPDKHHLKVRSVAGSMKTGHFVADKNPWVESKTLKF